MLSQNPIGIKKARVYSVYPVWAPSGREIVHLSHWLLFSSPARLLMQMPGDLCCWIIEGLIHLLLTCTTVRTTDRWHGIITSSSLTSLHPLGTKPTTYTGCWIRTSSLYLHHSNLGESVYINRYVCKTVLEVLYSSSDAPVMFDRGLHTWESLSHLSKIVC